MLMMQTGDHLVGLRGNGMNEWFDEYFEVNNRWGPKNHYKYYNPVTGEVYLNSILGMVSVSLSGFNLVNYMIHRDTGLAIILGIIGLVSGIIGLVLSIMNIPYSIRSKSIYRILVTVAGLVLSVAGILLCAGLIYVMLFLPMEALNA
jgi:hypothetical protein